MNSLLFVTRLKRIKNKIRGENRRRKKREKTTTQKQANKETIKKTQDMIHSVYWDFGERQVICKWVIEDVRVI